MIDFKKIFDDYAKSKQRVFTHDRTQTVGASEAFDCIRKAYFKKTGAEKDPDAEDSWGASSRGDLIENYHVVPALDAFLPEGYDYFYAGEFQKTFVDLENKISATPDGLVAGVSADALKLYGVDDLGSNEFVLEIKSVDPRVNLKEAKIVHRGQAIIQMGLIREQTNYKPNFAIILYFDASFLDKMTPFVIPFDEGVYNTAKKRAKSVYAAEDAGALQAEGKLSNSCDFCPFTQACARASKEAMPPEAKTYKYSDEDRAEMKILIDAQTKAAADEKDAEQRKKKASEDIKGLLKKLQIRRMAGDKEKGEGWSVSYTFVAGREVLDTNAMRADGIDIDSYKVAGEGHERVTISSK